MYPLNRIGGVMSVVDRGFESWSVQTKDFKIGICCFSAKHAALGERAKTGWLGIRILSVRVERHVYPRIVVSVS